MIKRNNWKIIFDIVFFIKSEVWNNENKLLMYKGNNHTEKLYIQGES